VLVAVAHDFLGWLTSLVVLLLVRQGIVQALVSVAPGNAKAERTTRKAVKRANFFNSS